MLSFVEIDVTTNTIVTEFLLFVVALMRKDFEYVKKRGGGVCHWHNNVTAVSDLIVEQMRVFFCNSFLVFHPSIGGFAELRSNKQAVSMRRNCHNKPPVMVL